jgi:hypothetical protein
MFYDLVPKDPIENLKWRIRCRERALVDPEFREALMQAGEHDPLFFMAAFLWVNEPRARVKSRPFIPWPHQEPVVLKMEETIDEALDSERPVSLTIKKSRAQGGTFLYIAVTVRRVVIQDHFTVGMVTRNESLVDSKVDDSAVLYKVAAMLDDLPIWMLPKSYERSLSEHVIKLPNGSGWSGYAATGDVARGGRTAQPLDSNVLTPHGWRPMGDLQVGDWVIGASGAPVRVTGVYPLGEKQVFRVRFNDGSSTECCDDHLWTVTEAWRRHSRKEHAPVTKPLRILRQSLRTKRKDQTEWNYQIPITKPVSFDSNPLPVHPYVLGCLLGDGCFRHSSPTFTTSDEEMAKTIDDLLPEGTKMVKCGEIQYRISSGKRGGRDKNGCRHINPVTNCIRDLQLWMTTSHTKFIPDCYKFSTVEDRLELLRGLLDTDGWIHVRGKVAPSAKVCYCSVSPRMVADVRFIVQSLGGVASMSVKQINGKKQKRTGIIDPKDVCYELRIAMPAGMNPFRLSRKAGKYVERSKYMPRRSMVAVEPSRIAEVQCISVDAEDGLYLTDDCIVTHNTMFCFDEPGSEEFVAGNKDYKVMSSVGSVSNCIVLCSTFGTDSGVFYESAMDPDNKRVVTLDWKDNPEHSRLLYTHQDGVVKAIRPEDQEAVENYIVDHYNEFRAIARKGHKIEGKIRSPWYDSHCLLPGATPRYIARELDMDARGAVGKVFSPDLIDKMKQKNAKPPVWRGVPIFDDENLSLKGLVTRDDGPLSLWFKPGVDNTPPLGPFTIACDIASGGVGAYSSNSVASGLDNRTGEQVMEYTIKGLEPRPFARRAVGLAIWLRNALLGWEDSGVSGGFAREVMEVCYYGNVYFREVMQLGSQKKSRKPGFPCRDVDKADMFERFAMSMEDGTFTPRSAEMLMECGEYEWENGKIIHAPTKNKGAMDKNHGDRAIAAAGAWLVYASDGLSYRVDSGPDTGHNPEYGSFLWREQQERRLETKGSPRYSIRDVLGSKDW